MRITCSALTDSDIRIYLKTVETVGDRDVAVSEPDPVGEDDLQSLFRIALLGFISHCFALL